MEGFGGHGLQVFEGQILFPEYGLRASGGEGRG